MRCLVLAASLLCAIAQDDDELLLLAAPEIAELQARLAAAPQDADLRSQLAAWQFGQHLYAAALETLRPLGPESRRLRAQCLYMLGRYEEALPLLDLSDPVLAVMHVDALEALGRMDEIAAALAAAEESLGILHPTLLGLRGRDLARRGRHAEAVEAFRAALGTDAANLEALHGLGQSLLRLGRREEGLSVMQEHRRLAPLIDRLDHARRGLELDPAHAGNHAAVGDALRDLGDEEGARAAYLRAWERAGADELVPIALRRARQAHEADGDLAGALALLDEARGRVPDARLDVRAGDLLLAAGRADEAVRRYEQALVLRPGDAQILERLARARTR